MKRATILVVLLSLILSTTPVPAAKAANAVQGGGPVQSQPPGRDAVSAPGDKATSEASKTESCQSSAGDSHIVYPAVDAAYVGGTIPEVLKTRPNRHDWLGFLVLSQFRLRGRLVIGECNLEFVMDVKRDERAESLNSTLKSVWKPVKSNHFNLVVYPSKDEKQVLSEAQKACKALGLSSESRLGYISEIPYGGIKGLSRDQVTPTDRNADRTAYIAVATSILPAVLGVSSKSHDKLLYGGVAGSALGLG